MCTILVVCTANICRSPVVEAYLRDRLTASGYSDWVIHSAGTWVEESRRASRYSIEMAGELLGLDIRPHRSRLVTPKMIREADLVIVMAANHAEVLRIENRSQTEKIVQLSTLADGREYDVEDPYGGPREEYRLMVRNVVGLVDRALDTVIKRCRQDKVSKTDSFD